MNKPLFPLAICSLTLIIGCATTQSPTPVASKEPVLSTDMQKSSYAQGVQYAELLQRNEIPVDGDLFLLGINDVLNKKPMRLNPEQLQRGKDWLYVQQMLYMDRTSKKNIADGDAFLKQNKNKAGVVSLPSGVQYKIISGSKNKQKPTLKDTVAMNYKVRKLDGEVFFSTEKEPKAPIVKVSTVIPGWQKALLKMPVGSKWELYVPGPLAYGENVAPEGKLKPNELMVIETELVEINPVQTISSKDSASKPIITKTSSW
ncbi:MAG: FKBP-type peptidyl-prolyl cis-trans isomerase N-terminal domain-containing protein [Methyloglobulus sp.]|nr:FKBP-type peptidyl-prolyl cis-trans isomerase [Methyloglobulus sp.]